MTNTNHFAKNTLAAALLMGFAAFASAQTSGTSAGTTGGTTVGTTASPSTAGSTTGTTGATTATTGRTATITTESGRTATTDIPTATSINSSRNTSTAGTSNATTGSNTVRSFESTSINQSAASNARTAGNAASNASPQGLEHSVRNPAPDLTPGTDTLDDTRGSSVAAQARENRGQGRQTADSVRRANPSGQNSQSTLAASPNFDTLDINKDGWVSLAELPVGNTAMSGSFSQYDSDGDSRLSRAEFDSFLTASDDSGEMDEASETE